jgi:hypothetical protein
MVSSGNRLFYFVALVNQVPQLWATHVAPPGLSGAAKRRADGFGALEASTYDCVNRSDFTGYAISPSRTINVPSRHSRHDSISWMNCSVFKSA